MERYTFDKMLLQRRLEVRFEGESGFDAASGDEAGVTRGFYADVAEVFLSCEHILANTCGTVCPSDSVGPLVQKAPTSPIYPVATKGRSKLPNHERLLLSGSTI